MCNFGNRLAELRNKKNLTRKELSFKLNIPLSTIGMYEQNRRIPKAEKLNNIANFFDVSVDYLIGNTDIPQIVKNINKETTQDIIATLTPEQKSELNMLLKQHNGLLMMSGIEPTENDKRELSRLITLSYLKSLGKIIK